MVLDGRVVLVRHRAGKSTYHLLPGGGVRYRETLRDALVREIREETGLIAQVGRPLLISDTIDPHGRRHLVNITFAADVASGEITDYPDDQRVEAVELVEIGELASLDLRPPYADKLVRILSGEQVDAEYLGPLFSEGH